MITRTVRKLAARCGLAHSVLRVMTRRPVILLYHGVMPRQGDRSEGDHKHVAESLFEEQLDFLQSLYEIVPLHDMIQAMLQGEDCRGRLAITFDDGYLNNAECAAPILARRRLSAAIFLATGFIGEERWAWTDRLERAVELAQPACARVDSMEGISLRAMDEARRTQLLARLKDHLKRLDWRESDRQVANVERDLGVEPVAPYGKYRFMSWDDARRLHSMGFEIGAHTINHAILSRVAPEEARREIQESRAKIQAEIGFCSNTFCYPNGRQQDIGDIAKGICHESFAAALSAMHGAAHIRDRYDIRRVGVGNESTIPRLAASLAVVQ